MITDKALQLMDCSSQLNATVDKAKGNNEVERKLEYEETKKKRVVC